MVSYPDFVVTKKTARQKKMLVIMPTQNAYYIKTESSNGQGDIEKLNAQNLSGFLTNVDSVVFPDNFWIHRLPEGKQECVYFIKYLNTECMADMLKDHAAPDIDYGNSSRYNFMISIGFDYIRLLYMNCPTLFKAYGTDARFSKFMQCNAHVMKDVYEVYGVDCSKRFVEHLLKSLVECGMSWFSNYGYMKNFQEFLLKYRFSFETFCDYVFYDSVMMGYAESMNTFFTEWEDSLDMQMGLYNKIKNKYPKDLPLYHNQMSYKSKKMSELIVANNFERQSQIAQTLERRIGKYTFIAPLTPDDFREEATQQANCLASYIKRFADGYDFIMFMRYADAPDTSLVTVELSPKLELMQAYQARNREITQEQAEAICEWIEELKKEEVA